MKHLTKCYLYFGVVVAFLGLLLLNFILTGGNDGFIRLKSQLGIKLQPLFCFQQNYKVKICE